jgi:hypothetical protein
MVMGKILISNQWPEFDLHLCCRSVICFILTCVATCSDFSLRMNGVLETCLKLGTKKKSMEERLIWPHNMFKKDNFYTRYVVFKAVEIHVVVFWCDAVWSGRWGLVFGGARVSLSLPHASCWFFAWLILKMEATCSTETSDTFHWTTWWYIPEGRTFHNHRC